jgi:NAD(P)-dependent dehydrogenase (short-subunit alcohol dehydrogenase family)
MAKDRLPLDGLTAVITGGGGGIGSATASVLVGDGAHVLIAGRTESTLRRVGDALEEAAKASGGSIRWAVCDGLDEDQVRNLVSTASEPTGRVDMAVNVVGGGRGILPVLRANVADVEATLRQNITSAFLLIKHAGGAMVRDGGGSIVAVSSMQATQTAPLLASYCAAKAGLEMLCRVAADELGEHGVRVNVVRPGLTRNGQPTHLSAIAPVVDAYIEQQPIRRPGEAVDIAHAIRYLAGPESSWVTGEALTVDGGTSLRRFPDLRFHWRTRLANEMDLSARGEVD